MCFCMYHSMRVFCDNFYSLFVDVHVCSLSKCILVQKTSAGFQTLLNEGWDELFIFLRDMLLK
jgi:hypothetical protein